MKMDRSGLMIWDPLIKKRFILRSSPLKKHAKKSRDFFIMSIDSSNLLFMGILQRSLSGQ